MAMGIFFSSDYSNIGVWYMDNFTKTTKAINFTNQGLRDVEYSNILTTNLYKSKSPELLLKALLCYLPYSSPLELLKNIVMEVAIGTVDDSLDKYGETLRLARYLKEDQVTDNDPKIQELKRSLNITESLEKPLTPTEALTCLIDLFFERIKL